MLWQRGCLSVTRRYCIKRAKPILKLFQPSGSPIIPVFDPCADTQIQGKSRQWDRKIHGVGKFCVFLAGQLRPILKGGYQRSQFYPHEAMLARSLPLKAVCPSVRLAVRHTPVTAKPISKLSGPSGSPSFRFFDSCADTQVQGKPRQRDRKIHGVGKFCNFRLKSPSISETVRDRPMVTMKC